MRDILKAASELGLFTSIEMKNGSIFVDGREPTSEELAAIELKADELQAEYDADDYKRKRKAEYEKLNQFEMLFDLGLNGWMAEIQKIKNKYPKG